jgi:3-oxoacyl-[acyl-carrier-protein] synthase III
MKVGFETVVEYVPAEVLHVKDHYAYLDAAIARLPKAAQEKLRSTAPDEVRRLKDASAAEIMALGAGQKALDRSGLTPSDIDCLLVTQTGGKQFMPLLGTYIHLNMGLKLDTIVRNIVDDNASILDASYVGWNFVRSGLCRRVLVIAVAAQIGGQVRFGVDLTDPLAQNFGDGAAAAIISSQNLTCEFLSYHFETYAVRPRTGGTLIANIGAVRPLMNPDLAAKAGVENKNGAYLVLEDPLFDEIAGRSSFITDSLERALKKASLELKDLDTVIAPHIGDLESTWIKDLVRAGLRAETYKNLRVKYGNTAVADVLIDLAEFGETGRLGKDSIIALWVPCVGVQLAALVLRWLA